ncbi:MAG: thioesterase family protein [Actinomycetota bacterium]
MKEIPPGYEGHLGVVVTEEMTVQFHDLGKIHPVYATYWIARHMEEAGRKVIVPFLEEADEGLGTAVAVNHLASALPGMRVEIIAKHVRTEKRKIICECTATSELGDLIATGSTEQVVLPAAKVQSGFDDLEERWRLFQEAKRRHRPDIFLDAERAREQS